MTRAQHPLWRLLAWVWLALVLALVAHQIGFWRADRFDTDVLALLPGERADAASADALKHAAAKSIANSATRQVVVLIGSGEWSQSRDAAQAFQAALASDDSPLQLRADEQSAMAEATALYAPHRRGLLTTEQRQWLQHTSADALAEASLARLYGPGLSGGISAWRDDPLGLWPDWWQARLGDGLHVREGLLCMVEGDTQWAVLRFESTQSAFQLDGEQPLRTALDRASEAAQQAVPGGSLRIVHGGVPLHAEAAAARASWEVNTIGLGSLLAVLLLAWLAFRSVQPLLLIALSLLIGTAAGVAVTDLVFGKLHLLTLVFGASLVGVAEDYGIHYFASRQARPAQDRPGLFRHLLPGLLLALATSVLAYLALGLAPFPGLRQMAVFSASGLIAAFLTVALWFPWLDRARLRPNVFSQRIAASLLSWPRLQWDRKSTLMVAGIFLIFTGIGLTRLTASDDLRSLQSSPPELWAQERVVGDVLGLPSPAQYFVVSGDSAEQLLTREEALTDRLQVLARDQRIAGHRAISDWLPSQARQDADRALSASAEAAVLTRLATMLDETPVGIDDSGEALSIHAGLASAVMAPLRPLWLGKIKQGKGRNGWGSVVLVQGLNARSDLDRLGNAAQGIAGVRWVNRSAEISDLLGHYRRMMSGLLVLGYAGVACALWLRFRRHAWRALLPTMLAAVASLAALGWWGEPLHLFNIMAQMLLLGIGVDYGIFIIEHRDDPASWLAVSLGAASTVLAFGLLALSATPALHGFGLSLLVGIFTVWALSPCFRPSAEAHAATALSPDQQHEPEPSHAH